jgi:O-antigen ligase
VTGQTLGVGALLSFAGAVPSHKVKAINVGFLLVFLLHVMALLILGARGPALATFIAVGLLGAVLAYRNKITMTWRGVGLLGLGGCAVCITALFLLNNSLQFATLHRFAALFEQLDYSTLDRLSYYKSAFSVFMQHVWKGVGIGGWPYWFGLGDLPWHPHNIVLETAAELGVVGLLLLGYLLYQTFQGCCRLARHAEQSIDLIPVGLWLFAFINALKTGDLNDNILLFGAAGLVQGVRRFARQTKSTL